jgi:DNA polymerase-3 subunit epsilon
LLAEVYIDLIGARQSQLILADDAPAQRTGGINDAPRRQREVPLVARVTEQDLAEHRAFIAQMGEKAIWNEFLGTPEQATT